MSTMNHTRFQYSFILAPELKRSNVNLHKEQIQLMIDREKEHAGRKLGRLIVEHVGFIEQEDWDSFTNKRHVLDVVAFQTDRWGQFKRDLRDLLIDTLMKDSDIDKVKDLFDKLES